METMAELMAPMVEMALMGTDGGTVTPTPTPTPEPTPEDVVKSFT